jgi:hypothetical protein
MDTQEQEALFVAGYNKGRSDGTAQLITLLKIMFEIYPNGGEYDPLTPLLPDAVSNELHQVIDSFGQHRFREGQKYERERLRRKAEKASAAA